MQVKIILIPHCRVNKEDIDVLLRMLTVFSNRTLVDTTFLREFYYYEVAPNYPPDIKHKLCMKVCNDLAASMLIQRPGLEYFPR